GPGLARFAPAALIDQMTGAGADDQASRGDSSRFGGSKVAQVRRRLAAGVELLHEQLAMPADYRDGDVAFCLRTGGEQRQRRHAVKLGAPADRQAMRGGDTDADAGEAAGTGSGEDALGGATVHQLGDHGDQPLAMTAA